MRILVTGGTGVAGQALVARLREHAEVRVLTRRPPDRSELVQGDLDTGAGLATAVADVDVIAHCASAADYRHPKRDVAQVQRMLDALGGARPHLVYISIVGVDRVRFGYYRGKLATERLIEGSGVPHTILRATQFHELVLMFLMMLSRGPVALLPRGFQVDPVDVGEVADRMAELTLGEPAGRVPDLGGPRRERFDDLARAYLAATGRRRPLLRLPMPGRIAADFRAGGHLLSPGAQRGKITFQDYLRGQVGPDGSVAPPYDLRQRSPQR